MPDDLKQSTKSSFGWIELANYAANPKGTSSARRGICAVGTSLKFWNGSSWVSLGLVEGMNFGDLGDVTISSPAAGHIPIYSGSAWLNKAISGDATLTALGVLTIGNNAITTTKIADAAVTKSKLSYEVVTVTVSAGNNSGQATVTSGSVVLGYYPATNQDQFVDNISVSETTLTLTLAANATADNVFKVVLLKA